MLLVLAEGVRVANVCVVGKHLLELLHCVCKEEDEHVVVVGYCYRGDLCEAFQGDVPEDRHVQELKGKLVRVIQLLREHTGFGDYGKRTYFHYLDRRG